MKDEERDELIAALIAGIQEGMFYAKLVNGEVKYVASDFGGTEDALPLDEIARLDNWPSYWREL